MDSRTVTLQAIDRLSPPRTPLYFCNRDFGESDVVNVSYAPATGFVPSVPGMTEWGFVWEVLDGTMGQPKTHPLADAGALSAYRPPDPAAPGRFDGVAAEIARWPGRFVKFSLGITGFNQATFLRGYPAFLEDLFEAPDRAGVVLDFVFDFETEIIRRALAYPVDAVSFGDDWGTQQGLMIAPELWREVFRPRYASQFDLIRRAGKKVWFHSCGNVHAMLGDLIDIGADVVELLQPDVMGVDRLARDFGGKVCFCCSVDHQRRAIHDGREAILDYARRLRDTLGGAGGGFIGYVEDYACLGMSEENYQYVREAFQALNR